MAFDITTWKDQLKTRLPGWQERMKAGGVNSAYYFIAATSLLPVLQAAHSGDWSALVSLGTLLGGAVSTNLLANMMQKLKDKSDVETANILQAETQSMPELKAEVDALLEKLDALHAAELSLSDADKVWFAATIQGELSKLQSGIQYHATVNGSGAVAQGNGAVALGQDAKYVVGSYTENHFAAPDPQQIEKEKNASAHQKYLQKLRSHCQVLPLAALGGDEAEEALSLDTVYIDLDTQYDIRPKILAAIQKGQKVTANDLLYNEHLASQALNKDSLRRDEKPVPLPVLNAVSLTERVTLLGDPGAGKSTFVRKLLGLQAAVLLKERAPLMHIPADLLPVLVVLRELVLKLDIANFEKRSGDDKRESLLAAFQAHLNEELQPDFQPAFWDAFAAGRVLVLDGLDEVPQEMRQRVRVLVAALLNAHAVERLIITSRIRSYTGDAVFPALQTFTIRPFNKEQIGNFVKAWYAARVALGLLAERDRARRVDDLVQAATGNLAEIASNPMMLTSMAIIHQKDTELPNERVRLYKLVVDVLLRRWQKHKQGEDVTPSAGLLQFLKDEPRLLAALARLAYEAHSAARGRKEAADLPRKDALAILEQKEFLNDAGLASEFLDYIDQRAGLLKGNGGELDKPNSYSFPHRTFQEYLAGTYLLRGRSTAREYRHLAAEGDHWALAAQLGAEELFYNRLSEAATLDLAYDLCPNSALATALDQRLAVWSGSIALTVGKAKVETDVDESTGGIHYLNRLTPALLAGMQGDLLPPLERAEAGRILAKLGDPRPEVLTCANMVFCHVLAGEFLFGDEKKKLTIASDYWIGKYPVTNAQFDEFVAAEGYKTPSYWAEAMEAGYWSEFGFKGRFDAEPRTAPNDYGEPFSLPNHPVVGVSWYEALAFTRWLTEQASENAWIVNGGESVFQALSKAGKVQAALPTEEQWEKAARGTDGREYPWAGEFDANKTNVGETGINTTSAVGTFQGGKSPYGLLDASGNVWEWISSPYDKSSYVLRGGAFNDLSVDVRCVCRDWYLPLRRNSNFGFRLVVLSLA